MSFYIVLTIGWYSIVIHKHNESERMFKDTPAQEFTGYWVILKVMSVILKFTKFVTTTKAIIHRKFKETILMNYKFYINRS